MFSTSDTIVGVATPPGRGGLGVVRLSGADAHAIARRLLGRDGPLVPRHATVARLSVLDAGAPRALDEVIATFFERPQSYTAEDVVEIAAHGSPVVLDAAVRTALVYGARLAGPGEFTFRAFVNGRIDLTQAEAVADLIDAVTPRQAASAHDQMAGSLSAVIRPIWERLFALVARLEASLDFPDEGYRFIAPEEVRAELGTIREEVDGLLAGAGRGALLRQGARVVLLGRPNAGKSTLFNALVGSERAIVSAHPGTTRDVIAETLDLDGVPVTMLDTAGVRDVHEAVEEEGVARAWASGRQADLLLVVLDGSQPIGDDDRKILREAASLGKPTLLVRTKCDLERSFTPEGVGHTIEVSALQRLGLDVLRSAVLERLGAGKTRDREGVEVTNIRHRDLLRRCWESLGLAVEALDAFGDGLPEEVLLLDLNAARSALEEVTGARTPDDLLTAIFTRFCIGK